MFIGGLNWETTDESLRDYFSQFGEVSECTVMRDGPSGRSRGFGFLTFKDPKTVNIVMVKEHYLDGKIIDPKRAIPRDEQERTSKIFVGGVSQEATEQDFREYFAQFGRIVDATLMIDKETGRPRGFGFVTFDNEAAVDAALAHPDLRIHDKPIEVKKAQPRGNARDRNFEEEGGNRHHGNFRDRGHHNNNNNRFNNNRDQNHGGQDQNSFNNPQNAQNNMQNQMSQGGNQPAFTNGMSPAMLAQYWQRMQQYMMMMMQQQAQMQNMGRGAGQPGMMPNGANMGNFNPAMMAQMSQMQGMPGMPGGMNPMAMNGMAGMGGPQGQSQGFMNQQGFQPKSPNMPMQQPYNTGEGGGNQGDQKSGGGGQQDGSQMNPMGQMGQQNQMWNNNMFDDQSGQGTDNQGNRGGGMHGGFQNKNFQAPTGPKAGAGGPPPNAPTGPRNNRNAPSGPSGGGQGPYRSNRGGGYNNNNNNRGFHPYQRN
ncbi:Nucleolin [Dactylella cylindrospora]|nr:Nucleolin [Dactylella cylindrospora]